MRLAIRYLRARWRRYRRQRRGFGDILVRRLPDYDGATHEVPGYEFERWRGSSMRVKCGKCGRFLARARAWAGAAGEGYSWHVFLAEVRGDCSRCGPGVQAGDGVWWEWEAWQWPAELEMA